MTDPACEDGLEKALNQHTSDIYSKVVRTVPSEVKNVIKDLLKIYDAKNIKMVFRCLKDDKFPVEARADLVIPIGTLKEHILKALIESKTIEEAVSELESTEYGKTVSEAMQQVEEQKSLLPLELAIDKYVYEKAHGKIALSKEKNMVAVNLLLGTKIDTLNLKTLLRMRAAGSSVENIDDFIINASYNLSKDKLKTIAKAETIDEILSQLEGTNYSEVLAEVSTTFKDTGSLYQIENKLDAHYEQTAKQLSVKNGLGLGPALYLITGKEVDARKIRMFSSFNHSGIDIETGGAV
jgi:V/A-type H+-transporting ATPase subunit C